MTNIFRLHPEFQALGETGNLVFSTYFHIERSLPLCGPREPAGEPVDAAAARAVHAILLKLYRSKKPHWFHKPIMVPSVMGQAKGSFDDFAQWYWTASNVLFPRGHFMTVVRDPADVVSSSMTRWGWSFDTATEKLKRNYRLLLHPSSRVQLFVPYRDLVDDPGASVQRMMQFAGVTTSDKCLAAFSRMHAPNEKRKVDNAGKAGTIPKDVQTMFGQLLERGQAAAKHD